mmetsp:Transcript_91302/g.289427  ORF Transcript_91302/g.289427 Transcript_91302/m.289427 type:complete len:218 (-) Transcript_91302:32-685(-)
MVGGDVPHLARNVRPQRLGKLQRQARGRWRPGHHLPPRLSGGRRQRLRCEAWALLPARGDEQLLAALEARARPAPRRPRPRDPLEVEPEAVPLEFPDQRPRCEALGLGRRGRVLAGAHEDTPLVPAPDDPPELGARGLSLALHHQGPAVLQTHADPSRRRSCAVEELVVEPFLVQGDFPDERSCAQALGCWRGGDILARAHQDAALVAATDNIPKLA